MIIAFDDTGGLYPIIRSLKEMIVLPSVYPELFQHYQIKISREMCCPMVHRLTGKTLSVLTCPRRK